MPMRGLGYMPRGIPLSGWSTTDLTLTNTTGSDQVTTLTGEIFYRNITLNATSTGKQILRPAGYAIICDTLTLTNNLCLIQNNGANGAAGGGVGTVPTAGGAGDVSRGSAPVNGASGYQTFFQGGYGGGGATTVSAGSTGVTYSTLGGSDWGSTLIAAVGMGGTGGAGGAVTGTSSAAGGVGGKSLDDWMAGTGWGQTPSVRGGPLNPANLLAGYIIWPNHSGSINATATLGEVPANAKFAGGGGGGGGAANTNGLSSGDGGGGGGGIYIVCRRLDISGGGIIQANGGNGGNAVGSPGSNTAIGGGGGGGGGAVVLIYGEMFEGTGLVQATGGNGGNGITGGGGATTQGGRGGQGGGIYHVTDLGSKFVRGASGSNGTP